MWATNASWVWLLFYSVFGISLAASAFSLIIRKRIGISVLHIVILVTGFMVFFLNAMGRSEGMTELHYFWKSLREGALWAIYVLISGLFSIYWWYGFVISYRDKG
ncbi:hypothetical protein [Paenibacillus thiaminolyticus]|uniref:Uncharacterized protein n=1 Tax=Paenibacillus thiaminolyticus TaxID=49283 RepID=A0A3A3GKP4_PANTH|nr:hypothetical protein [Paenibacillus thiaminolyticus]RJG23114.1 hypothetical protein DQX05_14670 [Paenibacillus thiaminolyticus]